VRRLLEKKCIPVVHGDTICDSVLGTKILSTEAVLMECMLALREQYDEMTVVYLLDSDGVVDKDGKTIPILKADDTLFVNTQLEHDVTGGIVGKIQSARAAARVADKVFLINGAVAGELRKAFTAGNVGTIVEP
jgi:isopentenyl phosphate kinase